MADLIEEVEVSADVLSEFRKGFAAHAALAAVRQERLNAACRQLKSRLMEGVGQLQYRIDSDFYWLARHQHGAGCWSDPEFRRDCEEKGAIQRVEGVSDKIVMDMGRGTAGTQGTKGTGGLICAR